MKPKRNILIYTFILAGLLLMLTNSFTRDRTARSLVSPVVTVTDIDGNVYHTVTIGIQVWMAENLKTTKYSDGTNIPNVTDNYTWDNLTKGAYCNYDNTPSKADTNGRLYNWYAATDTRNICPTGWHMPSDSEWTILTTYLGGEDDAGDKLKETGESKAGAFSALPCGTRYYNGLFYSLGESGYWWSSTEINSCSAWSRYMNFNLSSLNRLYDIKRYGFSVRCIKD